MEFGRACCYSLNVVVLRTLLVMIPNTHSHADNGSSSRIPGCDPGNFVPDAQRMGGLLALEGQRQHGEVGVAAAPGDHALRVASLEPGWAIRP